MKTFALVLIVLAVLYLIAEGVVWNAPDGWEDDEGFHYGIDPRSK